MQVKVSPVCYAGVCVPTSGFAQFAQIGLCAFRDPILAQKANILLPQLGSSQFGGQQDKGSVCVWALPLAAASDWSKIGLPEAVVGDVIM